MTKLLRTARKALAAAFAGGASAVAAGITAGGVDAINWAVVAGAAFAAGVAVFYTKNKPA
jgi:hypothetical protein